MSTRLYTTAEAGKRLGVSAVTVWRWINLGRIRAVELGTPDKPKLRIRDDDLQQFIDDRTLRQTA